MSNTESFLNDTAIDVLELDGIKPPPTPHWCFDLMVFYRSFDDEASKLVVHQLEQYSKFSFVTNGIMTSILAMFGLIGNILLVLQIRRTRHFSRRLALHLSMLCCWDIALLFSCLLTYGISCVYYGIIPFVGTVAYLLYFFQPFASFCVTGTIWQVLAITVERYFAVSRPLEQRTRNAQFSVRAICSCIVIVAFLLNMSPVPFEHALTDCYEMTPSGDYNIRTMIIQQHIDVDYYAIVVHLIPDIIFRAPTPIIAIAILTVRTLQICSTRTIGTQTIQARRNVPYMLTLLNIKFIMCNTLYMFNTILMEVLGYGGKISSSQTELEMEQYIQSLYLTDMSNMLLAVHSATNWLIFYHWPKFGNNKKYSNLTANTSSGSKSKVAIIDCESAELLLSKFSANKRRICIEMLATLCMETPHLASLCVEDPTQYKTKEQYAQHIKIQKHGSALADIIEEVLLSLTNKNAPMGEIRELCRRIGYQYYEINLHCGAQHWKLVRDILVASITQSNYPNPKWHSSKIYQSGTANLQKTFIKVFNFALREMKSGALCAIVDASHQHLKQKQMMDHTQRFQIIKCNSAKHEPKKKSMKNALLRGCESLSFIIPKTVNLDFSPSSGNSKTKNEEHDNIFLAKPMSIDIGDLEKQNILV